MSHLGSTHLFCFLIVPTKLRGCGRNSELRTNLLPSSPGSSSGRLTKQNFDFGMVRPKTIHKHAFEIHNPTNSTWTVKKVRTSCVCTASSMTADRILPGTSEGILVYYRATSQPEFDTRSVFVEFKEYDIPSLTLTVNARIVEPLHLDQRVIQKSINRGEQHDHLIQVDNTSGHVRSKLKMETNASWLTFDLIPLVTPRLEPQGQAHQKGRLLLKKGWT